VLYDSDDEEVALQNEYDKWHQAKRQLAMQFMRLTNLPDISILGFGFPQRTPSYIGIHKWMDEEEYRKSKEN
jgi:hypothetical protein